MDDYIFCYECEENFHCPDAQRKDGCEWGLKTPEEETNAWEEDRPETSCS